VSADVGAIEFRLLGPPEVVLDGGVVPIGSLQQRALLVALLLARDAVVSPDRLIDVVWGDDPPPSAASTLRGLVWRLRKRLPQLDLEGHDDGYRLVAGDRVDARRFDRLAAEGHRAVEQERTEAAAASFGEALSLWHGPALGELASWPFARAEATRLDEARLDVTEDLAEAELALGRIGAALGRLESLVRDWPLRERAVGQLMVALYRTGRQADALAAYQALRHALAEELGLVPTPALRDLEAAILRQSDDLLVSPPRPASAEAARRPVALDDTVAFLFTDIEASTRAWEGDVAAMGPDLARHDAILSDVCAAWDGDVFAHTGDGLCIAFPTAAAAIGAAVEAQRALDVPGWRRGVPPRVRMAIHAGAAQRRGDNWFGPTLNRTARLLTAAGGGQVLCSETAAGLARDLLPEQVELVDCGEVDLPDLARPERIYRCTHPDLGGPSAPLRSPTRKRPRNNLPLALTRFVGRAGERAEVQSLVAGNRLVTLSGPGGAGKTRLALEVAGGLEDAFPDGVWLIELASVSDGTLVVPRIAAGVGLLVGELAQSGDLQGALAERLRNRRLLVVLDNCEQVIDAAASAAHSLLGACPGLSLLATSREPLAVTGEVVFSVPPLSLPPAHDGAGANGGGVDLLQAFDAVALFCARAHDLDRRFSLSEANADAIVRICRRLDGLPLALELAAARARVLGTKQLAAQLDDRFAALGEGSRTAPRRHQTLRAAIDWSHDLLSPTEQTVFRRLAVFPADFNLDAVRSVMGSEAIPPFVRLVDKSLVSVTAGEPEVRYQLSESVRAYAAEMLTATGELEEARRSHRDAFLAVAAGWLSTDRYLTISSQRRAAVDYANFMAALEWSCTNGDGPAAVRLAAALTTHWYWAGHVEGCMWAQRAAAFPISSPAMAGPAAITRAGLAYLLRNYGGDAGGQFEALMAEAIAVAETADDSFARGVVRARAADVALVTDHLDDAREHLGRAQDEFVRSGSLLGIATCDTGWAFLAMSTGDLEAAARALERPLQVLPTVPESYLVPHTLGCAALILAQTDDPSATRLGEEAVAAARRYPAPQVLVMALARAAEAAVLSGERATARSFVVELVQTLRHLGARRWVAEAFELAAIVFGEERPETAAVALGAADRLRRELGETPGPAFVLADALEEARGRIAAALGADAMPEHLATGSALPVDEALAVVAGRLGS
jgi:predicted ATPase/DNA-binding SARP family transcriptional activator